MNALTRRLQFFFLVVIFAAVQPNAEATTGRQQGISATTKKAPRKASKTRRLFAAAFVVMALAPTHKLLEHGTASSSHAAEETEDISREGISAATLLRLPAVLNPLSSRQAAHVGNVSRLNLDALQQARIARGLPPYKALIFDIDETLAKHHGAISEEYFAKLEELLNDGVVVLVYSNASSDYNPQRRQDIDRLARMGVVVADNTTIPGLHSKPHPKGFSQVFSLAQREYQGLNPGQKLLSSDVAMVGDDPSTDGAAVNAGLDYIHVTPKGSDKPWWKPSRLMQTVRRDYTTTAADHFNLVRRALHINPPIGADVIETGGHRQGAVGALAHVIAMDARFVAAYWLAKKVGSRGRSMLQQSGKAVATKARVLLSRGLLHRRQIGSPD